MTTDSETTEQYLTFVRSRFLSGPRDIDIAILSVCLSVHDTLVLYENGLIYRHSFFTFFIIR